MPCSLVDIYRLLEGINCLHFKGKTEIVHFSETAINILQITWRYVSEESNLLRKDVLIYGFSSYALYFSSEIQLRHKYVGFDAFTPVVMKSSVSGVCSP
jgi:hypothetical protein